MNALAAAGITPVRDLRGDRPWPVSHGGADRPQQYVEGRIRAGLREETIGRLSQPDGRRASVLCLPSLGRRVPSRGDAPADRTDGLAKQIARSRRYLALILMWTRAGPNRGAPATDWFAGRWGTSCLTKSIGSGALAEVRFFEDKTFAVRWIPIENLLKGRSDYRSSMMRPSLPRELPRHEEVQSTARREELATVSGGQPDAESLIGRDFAGDLKRETVVTSGGNRPLVGEWNDVVIAFGFQENIVVPRRRSSGAPLRPKKAKAFVKLKLYALRLPWNPSDPSTQFALRPR